MGATATTQSPLRSPASVRRHVPAFAFRIRSDATMSQPGCRAHGALLQGAVHPIFGARPALRGSGFSRDGLRVRRMSIAPKGRSYRCHVPV